MTAKVRRPLEEMYPLAQRLVAELVVQRAVCVRAAIAGSLRRRRPDVGDIEIVAIPRIGERQVPIGEGDLFLRGVQAEVKLYNALWQHLDDEAEAGRVRYSKRGDKYRQFAFEGVQVDLFTAEPGNWGWIYLIRTGSADFSHRVASALNRRGYTSAEGYIRPKSPTTGDRIETPEEADVFGLAGMAWVDPERRG
jgi:DNA polymerase/3'-5' exonuclease PolX